MLKKYLFEGLVKKVPIEHKILSTYIYNAEESLITARQISSPLWKIVISYYAMFYIANALIYSKGYKIGHQIVHKITEELLKELLNNKELLLDYQFTKDDALELIQNYEFERKKRSQFQYEMKKSIKEQKANTSLKRAIKFVTKIKEIIQ